MPLDRFATQYTWFNSCKRTKSMLILLLPGWHTDNLVVAMASIAPQCWSNKCWRLVAWVAAAQVLVLVATQSYQVLSRQSRLPPAQDYVFVTPQCFAETWH
jgi:hypothetical protein